jgi:hypothetical protein
VKDTDVVTGFGSRLSLLVCAVMIIGTFSGCRDKDVKKEDKDQSKRTDGSQVSFSTAQDQKLELITETEEKERNDLKVQIRALAFKGDFAQLESMAKDFRENKTRFRNGYWKLRAFYTAFGNFPQESPESDWQNLIKQGEQWAKTYPQSATPRIALAEIYRGYAWVARTSNTADKVTEEGGRMMQERLRRASEVLQEASRLEQNCPGWYGTAQRVALGAELERPAYERLFESGVKAAPDYSAIYDYKAYYLLPRWYGAEGEWESFAIGMMKRIDIPASKEIFARAAIYLRDLGYFYQEFSAADQSWDFLKESFRETGKNYPDSLEVKSIFCLMCLKLCDYKEARAQMKLIGNKVDLSVWTDEQNFRSALNWLKNDDAALEKCRKDWKRLKRQ